MKIIVRKIIFFGILLLTFAVVQMWLGNLFPLSKPDLSWGITVKYHFIVYCGIIGVYSLLYPMSIAFYSALIFQTVSFWIFFLVVASVALSRDESYSVSMHYCSLYIEKYANIDKLFPCQQKRN